MIASAVKSSELARRIAQDDARIVVKSRPHRRPRLLYTACPVVPPTTPKPDKFPAVWIVGLVVMLLVTFTFTSNFFDHGYQNTYIVGASKTPAGYVPAGSTDATRAGHRRQPQNRLSFI